MRAVSEGVGKVEEARCVLSSERRGGEAEGRVKGGEGDDRM